MDPILLLGILHCWDELKFQGSHCNNYTDYMIASLLILVYKNMLPMEHEWSDNIRCNFARPDTVTSQLTDAPEIFIFELFSFLAEP